MLEHIHKMDERVVQLCKALNHLDARLPESELPKLELPGFCEEQTVATDADSDDAQKRA